MPAGNVPKQAGKVPKQVKPTSATKKVATALRGGSTAGAANKVGRTGKIVSAVAKGKSVGSKRPEEKKLNSDQLELKKIFEENDDNADTVGGKRNKKSTKKTKEKSEPIVVKETKSALQKKQKELDKELERNIKNILEKKGPNDGSKGMKKEQKNVSLLPSRKVIPMKGRIGGVASNSVSLFPNKVVIPMKGKTNATFGSSDTLLPKKEPMKKKGKSTSVTANMNTKKKTSGKEAKKPISLKADKQSPDDMASAVPTGTTDVMGAFGSKSELMPSATDGKILNIAEDDSSPELSELEVSSSEEPALELKPQPVSNSSILKVFPDAVIHMEDVEAVPAVSKTEAIEVKDRSLDEVFSKSVEVDGRSLQRSDDLDLLDAVPSRSKSRKVPAVEMAAQQDSDMLDLLDGEEQVERKKREFDTVGRQLEKTLMREVPEYKTTIVVEEFDEVDWLSLPTMKDVVQTYDFQFHDRKAKPQEWRANLKGLQKCLTTEEMLEKFDGSEHGICQFLTIFEGVVKRIPSGTQRVNCFKWLERKMCRGTQSVLGPAALTQCWKLLSDEGCDLAARHCALNRIPKTDHPDVLRSVKPDERLDASQEDQKADDDMGPIVKVDALADIIKFVHLLAENPRELKEVAGHPKLLNFLERRASLALPVPDPTGAIVGFLREIRHRCDICGSKNEDEKKRIRSLDEWCYKRIQYQKSNV